jgi:hypothetical protein
LKIDDVLLVQTSAPGLIHLREMPGLVLLPLDSSEFYAGEAGAHLRELIEVVLDSASPLVGHRMVNSRVYFPRPPDFAIVAYHSFEQGPQLATSGFQSRASWGSLLRKPSSNLLQALEDPPADAQHHRSRAATEAARRLPGIHDQADQGSQQLRKVSFRPEMPRAADIPERRLARGDHLIFDAPQDFYRTNKTNTTEYVTVRRLSKAMDAIPMQKAYIGGMILFVMICLVASSTLPLLEAVLGALFALVLTGCSSLDSVKSAVKLSTVLTIVGAFGLGKAIGQQKVAAALADLLLFLLQPFGTLGLLAAIFVATVALGVIFHGTAVVVLMYPICAEVASKMHEPIHMMVGTLCIAVAMQVLSPISYQTNLMAFAEGGYEFVDFTYLGSGLVIVIGMICVPLMQYWFS